MEDDVFEDYVKKQGYDSLEDYLKTTTENAKKNLEKEMKILAIAKENDLWLDDEELGKEILNRQPDIQAQMITMLTTQNTMRSMLWQNLI